MSTTLREQLAEALAEHAADGSDEQRVNGEWTWGLNCDCGEFVPGAEVNAHLADALLPVIGREIAAARGEAREQIAQEVDRLAAEAERRDQRRWEASAIEDVACEIRAALTPDPDRGESA